MTCVLCGERVLGGSGGYRASGGGGCFRCGLQRSREYAPEEETKRTPEQEHARVLRAARHAWGALGPEVGAHILDADGDAFLSDVGAVLGRECSVVLQPGIDTPSADDCALAFCVDTLDRYADPLDVLRRIRARLAPGGRLYVRVPSIETGSEDLARTTGLPPRIHDLTCRTLAALLIRAGFERTTVGLHVDSLWALTHRSESEAPTYDAIEEALDGALPTESTEQIVVALPESAGPRAWTDAQLLGAWLSGEPMQKVEAMRPDAGDVIRAEVQRMDELIGKLRATLGAMVGDLDREARRCGEAYSTDAFLRGYLMGKSRQSVAVGQALTAVSNNLVVAIRGDLS